MYHTNPKNTKYNHYPQHCMPYTCCTVCSSFRYKKTILLLTFKDRVRDAYKVDKS